jgi:hypothetical protein
MSDEVFSIEIKKGVRVMARYDANGNMQIFNEKKEWVGLTTLTVAKYNSLKYSNHITDK